MPIINALPLHFRIERELGEIIALPEFRHGALIPTEMPLVNRFTLTLDLQDAS